MNQNESYYRQLLQRYLRDELSAGDGQELFDYIQADPQRADRLLDASDRIGFEERLRQTSSLPEDQTGRMYSRLLDNIRKTQSSAPVVPIAETIPETDKVPDAGTFPPSRIHPLRRYGWAAAILLITAGWGGYTLYFKKPAPPIALNKPHAATRSHDIPPGTNTAVLTLAGGRQIILDSSAKGAINSPGAVSIINTNGQLTYHTTDGDKPEYNTLTTQMANQYRLVLADGTRVWLDASSSITYPTVFTGKERHISITGQAYLEVAHDAQRPFTVEVNGHTISDIGTAFNINAYKDESAMKITLAEGSISVKSDQTEMTLSRVGQQVESSNGKLQRVGDADLETVLAWKNGHFSFEGADVRGVMRQISRWYGVEVRYEGKPAATLFGGEISRDLNLSQVLEGLSRSELHFRLEGNVLTVLP